MDSCTQSSTVLVCNQLVRRTNFLLHLFTGSLQLKQGLERGLHSDINSDRAGRKSPPHWETTHLDCVHLCVCVWLWCAVSMCWREFANDQTYIYHLHFYLILVLCCCEDKQMYQLLCNAFIKLHTSLYKGLALRPKYNHLWSCCCFYLCLTDLEAG